MTLDEMIFSFIAARGQFLKSPLRESCSNLKFKSSLALTNIRIPLESASPTLPIILWQTDQVVSSTRILTHAILRTYFPQNSSPQISELGLFVFLNSPESQEGSQLVRLQLPGSSLRIQYCILHCTTMKLSGAAFFVGGKCDASLK